jgi:hypothetical protein
LILLLVALLLGSMLGYPTATPALAAPPLPATLPGGTSIAVSIDSPADGAVLPAGPVTVTGTASVGTGAATPNTALIYVLDVSGSTTNDNGKSGADCDHNGTLDLILTCEVEAARGLNRTAATVGSVASVGVVGFSAGAVTADVSPGPGAAMLTGPGTDADGSGVADVDEVLTSTFSASTVGDGGFTRFSPVSVHNNATLFRSGVDAAIAELNAANAPNMIVAFMSDGLGDADPQIQLTADYLRANVPAGARFFTYAIGANSNCGGGGPNTLQVIADATGAQCTKVTGSNLANLADQLSSVVASHLTGVTVSVDGTTVPADVTPALPQTGPKTVSYQATVPLSPGRHRICTDATGADGGRTGGTTPGNGQACREIIVDSPPTVDAGGPYSGPERAAIPIRGTATDPDEGQQLTTSWAVTSGPSEGCTVADPAALATTVSCPAAGDYVLTLTAGDGITGPVPSTAKLTVAHLPPVVDAGGPYTGEQGTSIPLLGTASDPDELPVSTTWAITSGPGVDPAANCTFGDPAALTTNVSCTVPGGYGLTLTGTNGFVPATSGTTLEITNQPPVVSAGGPYTGTAGIPVTLTGTVADPDSPGLTLTWSVSGPPTSDPPPSDPPPSDPPTSDPPTSDPPTGEPPTGDPPTDPPTDPPPPPAGACSFTDVTVLSPLITCPTPGTYTLTLTAKDGFNDPVSATTTLTVVPARIPVSSLSLSGAGTPTVAFVGGTKITITYTVRNAGETPMPAVRLATRLPAALSAPASTCVPSCDLGDLRPGEQKVVTITLPPTAAVDGKIVAVATTTGPDTTAADNTASVRVLIRQPTLVIDPTTGPPGLVTHAMGRDFPAGAILHLAWSDGITQLPGNVLVGRDGTFETQALVFNHDGEGPRTLVATLVRGTPFGPVLSNSFLLARRAFEPPFDQSS